MAKKKMQPSAAGFVEIENKAIETWESKEVIADAQAEPKPSRKKAEKKSEPVQEPEMVSEPAQTEESVVLEAEEVATKDTDTAPAE